MALDKIRAPYGFVPLSQAVVFPDWADAASQDWPFEDGLRGHLDVSIEALSPIFVRDPQNEATFFRAPDGPYGIPGSSLRGMLRNVVEIASFGKLNRFDRRRYGVRDLHNRDVYGKHMAEIRRTANGKNEPVPLVNAGWLVPADDVDEEADDPVVARIQVCHFAKIEYAELGKIARELEIRNFQPGTKQRAVTKYKSWARDGKALRRSFPFAIRALRERGRDRRLISDFGMVTGPGRQKGTLVFTGQPSDYDPRRPRRSGAGNPKHHDFVFYGDAGMTLEVRRSTFEDFEFIHSAGGEQHKLTGRLTPNEEWGFWRKESAWDDPGASAKRRRVPVFFLADERGGLRAFGLAMMFRLAYTQSVEDAVRAGQHAFDDPRPDLAETLFGRVGRDKRDARDPDATKGRVGVGFAPAEGAPRPLREVTLVLGTPKASYYPNYLEQQPHLGHGAPPDRSGKKPRYITYMDQGARIRGWKRYRPIEGHEVLRPPMPTKGNGDPMDTAKVATRFRPLPAGTRFKSRIRLHNVRPVEVGALLWAMELGGGDDAFHKLGLARPMGYGTVRLRVTGDALVDNDDRPADLEACRRAFVEYMERQVPGWRDTPQIRELLALARPMPKADARHMQINHSAHRNEFSAAKGAGLALQPASGSRPPPREEARRPPTSPGEARDVPGAIGWRPLPAGHRIEAMLVEQNKKGKWRFGVPSLDATGTVVQGQPPPDAAVGMRVTLRVIRASTRTNIEAAWTD